MENQAEIRQTAKPAFLQNPTLLVVLVLLVAGFLIFGSYQTVKIKKPSEPAIQSTSPPESIKQIPPEKLPSFFPAKIPLEKNAQVLQNYSQIIGNKEQSTRQFISQKSLEENFKLYKKYLIDDKWEIINVTEGAEINSLSAKKAPNNLNITISQNKQTNQVIVDITLVGPKLIKEAND